MEKSEAVLLVEPSPLMLLLERTLLARRGWEIRTATGCAEALAQLERALPSLVICSDRLPDGSAEELCRGLRARPETATLPFLFVVGQNTDRTVASLREAGADEILFKPLIAYQVDQVINRLLGLAVRRWKRQDFHTLVAIANGAERPHLAVARNLSVDGMLVEVPEEAAGLAMGDRASVRFFVPDDPGAVVGEAEVVWARRLDGRPHYGLRFYRLEPGGLQRVTRFCGGELERRVEAPPPEELAGSGRG